MNTQSFVLSLPAWPWRCRPDCTAPVIVVPEVRVPPPPRFPANLPVTLEAPARRIGALAKVDPSLLTSQGPVTVVIRFMDPPLSVAAGPNAKRVGPRLDAVQQRAYHRRLMVGQGAVVNTVTRNGGRVIARLTRSLNAVIATVEATAIVRLAELAPVVTIRPVGNYELDLSQTVPHVGAAAVHGLGVDGTGVRVAVLDSGVDYTHRNLGGAGTVEAYLAAYGESAEADANKRLDGLFPTPKVIGGYDFVGEIWPLGPDGLAGPLAPDPDPIDREGHGTHVADIIAGESLDGLHRGVAPGARLYAFKVCSAVATSCSGVAILQGLERAMDPDENGDLSDAVDVVNLSLGSSYGQIQDDSAGAVQNLVDFGIVVVASAGNSGDKPYVVGAPAIAPGVISVAQTQMPSAFAIAVRATQDGVTTFYPNTVMVDWAPVVDEVTGTLVLAGRGCPGDAYPEGADLAGKIALIDRGVCAVSLKVDQAARAGAVGVILANNVPGDPPGFSFGGGDTLVPTLVISQADGNALKALLALPSPVTVTFSPDVGTPLSGSLVASSSRGPAPSNQAIKPDVGAPGASVSAEVGTGGGETAFGGTSGAAPMVSGAAALLLEAFPTLAPHEVKARLMNTAERDILVNPVAQPGLLAPITRIGAGEVRVDRAHATDTIAYDRDSRIASLSFGYRSINAASPVTTLRKTVEIANLGSAPRTYTAENLFRYAEDAATAAVTVTFTPPSIDVPAGGVGYLRVSLTVNPALLPDWFLAGGARGGDGEALRLNEFDGHVLIRGGAETIALPWHLLPRKAADMRPDTRHLWLVGDPGEESGVVTVGNTWGSTAGVTEVFDLLGTSPLDYPSPPLPGADYALVDLKSFGARTFIAGDVPYVEFAVATHGEPAHPNYPAGIEIDIDVTGDGDPDFAVYHRELTGFAQTGQNVTAVYNVATKTELPVRFFTDCDLDASVMVFRVRLSDLGIGLGDPMQIIVWGYDNYFTGWTTDYIADGAYLILYTPGVPRFDAGPQSLSAAAGARAALAVRRDPVWGPLADLYSPSHTGLLLLHRQAASRRWTDEIEVTVP
ncbi:MAG: S8 family serine peptidase [Verrucomicrobia bacterium]|nr:S8 family serine peptidase [Verrucomicrobiota bacterium]